MHQLTQGFLGLFLQSNCPLCDRPAKNECCPSCQRQLQRCQLPNSGQFWQGELPVFVWGSYGGNLKRAIAALKYDNQPQLAEPLGGWLASAWRQFPITPRPKSLIVVPIPLHPKKRQKRGYNQAELIARRFAQVTGYSHQPHGLERVRETEAQFGLSGQAREQNLVGAFTVGKSLVRHSHTPVLLVDDIYTTGATARSAAQALRQQGIPVCGLVAMAAPTATARPSLRAGIATSKSSS